MRQGRAFAWRWSKYQWKWWGPASSAKAPGNACRKARDAGRRVDANPFGAASVSGAIALSRRARAHRLPPTKTTACSCEKNSRNSESQHLNNRRSSLNLNQNPIVRAQQAFAFGQQKSPTSEVTGEQERSYGCGTQNGTARSEHVEPECFKSLAMTSRKRPNETNWREK